MRGGWSFGERPGAAAIVVLWLLTTVLWLTPGITRPDGAGYFVYLPSTWLDHDLLFFDEWARVGLIRDGRVLFKDVTSTGHLSNHWTAGASLAWYPAFIAGDGLARTIGEVRDGLSPPYVTAVVFTSALAGLFVLLAGYSVARTLYGEWIAAAAAMAIWLGSPLAFYSLRHASMAHAISSAACAAVLLLSLRLREHDDGKTWFACGMAIGFACAVRPQNAFIALVPFLLGVRRPQSPLSLGRGKAATAVAALQMGAGAVLAALPQLIASQTIWGSPFAFLGSGRGELDAHRLSTFRPFETIFSWYHGLATWTPLALVAVIGFAILWRDGRGLARAAISTFVANWMILALLDRFFWGGASFGQRRFDSCAIFFILGLAAVLHRLPRWLGALVAVAGAGWSVVLFIASTKLNLNRFQTPDELVHAFTSAFANADARWRTFLGFAPPEIRGEMVLTIFVVAALAALLVFVARSRHAVAIAAAYFVAMSAFYAWCGLHPKHDALSRAILARPTPSGSAGDAATLLRYEAEYMYRTGRIEEAERAMRDAQRIAK